MFLTKCNIKQGKPESFCWQASSCQIRSVETLTGALWSGSPSSWCTESPSVCAGSAPRLTATCSAPFEKNETSLICSPVQHQIKMSSMFSALPGSNFPRNKSTFWPPTRLSFNHPCVSWIEHWMDFKWTQNCYTAPFLLCVLSVFNYMSLQW